MSQRVEYEALPGTRWDQTIPKLRTIVRFLATAEGQQFKVFRDFLRKQGVWDREKATVMLSLIDLSWDRQTVHVGALAKQLAQAETDDDARDLLFARLKRDNILLLKYVLEALDVESGGRLHSVHELYRMVTSYVYPGDYVTLPNFQAWVEWLAATAYIKMIGIRWGLSDKGLAVISDFTSMDVEEILEDMEEAAEEANNAAEEAEDVPVDDAPAVADEPEDILAGVVPQAPSAAVSMSEDAPVESAPAADAAPASEAEATEARPRAGRPAPVSTSLHPPEPVVRRVSGPATAGAHAPLASVGPVASAAVVADSAETQAVVEQIKGWFVQWHGWPVVTAQILGVDTGPEGVEGDALLVEVGVLAALVEGLAPQPQLFAGARRFRQTGFFDALHGDGGFAAAVEALGELDGEPWLRTLSERLMHARGICARVAAAPGLMDRLAGVPDGAAAVRMLRADLFGGAGQEAPFWVLRELVRDGMLDGKQFADATTVPTPRLLSNAARIGLIPSAEIASFDGLVAASAAVSAHFGQDAGYGMALEVMDRALGLASASP